MDLETTAKLEAMRSAMARSTQITTLSTAVVVLSGSILKDKFIATEYTKILWASWLMMGLSLIVGLLYLGSMSHRLGRVKTKEDLRIGPLLIAEIPPFGGRFPGSGSPKSLPFAPATLSPTLRILPFNRDQQRTGMKVIGLERILLLSQEVSFVVGMMMFGYFLAINV